MNLKPRTAWALLLLFSVVSLVGAAMLISFGAGDPGGTATQTLSPSDGAANHTPAPPDGMSPEPTGEGGTVAANATPTPLPTPLTVKLIEPHSAEPEDLTGYVWPLRNAWITSRFAARTFGGFVIINGKEYHDGLDLATHCGDKILAAHDGRVLYAGRNFDVFLGYRGKPEQIYARLERLGRVKSLPIVIVVDDGNGYRSMYVHLSKANVEAGDVVQAGDVIGKEGATGYATGCHLHYGIIRMDSGWQQVVGSLARFGYPDLVRERIDPLRVLAWDDPFAPQRLQDRANPSASPAPAATAIPLSN
jgi:murein DD-endopeptidase MepM/ murein hydrolase activator NlpD